MISKTVKISNAYGIHCRPSSRIMHRVLAYPECTFMLKTQKGDIDLTSILELISLGLENGEDVTLEVNGVNEKAACDEISSLLAYNFDFPPRY